MVPYYILVVSPFIAVLFQHLFRKRYNMCSKKNNVAIVVFFFIYFLLVALRHEKIGSDTWNYVRIFNIISDMNWKNVLIYFGESDLGYYLFNKFFSIFFSNVQFFLSTVAFISIYPIAKFYYEESENSLLTISLFLTFPVFIMNFSGLRQGIAIALGVLAFQAAKKRNIKKFILIVVLAIFFHASAVILLLIYPFYAFKVKRKHLYFFMPLFAFSFLFNREIYIKLIPLFGKIYDESYGEVSETGAYSILILLVIFVVYAFLAPRSDLIDDKINGLRNMLLIAMFLQVFVPVNQLVMRINYYFLVFIPVVIPMLTNRWTKTHKEYRWLINSGMCLFFIWYYLDRAHSMDSLNIYPYIFFWERL